MLKPQIEFEINNFVIDKTRDNKDMAKLELINPLTKETFKCVIWEETLNSIDKRILKNGNIITVLTSSYIETFKNYVLNKIQLVKEVQSGLNEEQREVLYSKIIEIINGFSNQNLKTSILTLIFENEELFKVSPAAEKMHHNYVGGLMQHICECINIANSLFPIFYREIDHELIIAACIMHDIGKIFEYVIDIETDIIKYNVDFEKSWINHIQYGYCWAMTNGFKELARIIAAHHGRADWGAIIDLNQKNLEPELYLMHHIDDISAKFGAVSSGILNNNSKSITV